MNSSTTTTVIRTLFYGDEAAVHEAKAFDELSTDVLDQFTRMAAPSRYLVDSIPIRESSAIRTETQNDSDDTSAICATVVPWGGFQAMRLRREGVSLFLS